MEDAKELILPSALIVLGLFVFMIPGESDFEPLTVILPYFCSAPFMLTGCFILSKRVGAVEGPKLTLANNLFSTEGYLEYKEKEKARDQQSIGYMIMLGSAISGAFIFVIGLLVLIFIAAMSFGASSNDDFTAVFSFFFGLLKICFWTYVGSHVIIARPWQYFGEMGEEKPVEAKRLVQCPACDATMRVPVAYEGRARCPACGEEFKA
tara:strand:+ start:2647 stop:3270 length:624 start_codon:yes stop_codon:yes gene_type:complete